MAGTGSDGMPRVLAVDDDPTTLRFMSLFLRREGYEVHAADDGKSALAAAEAAPPDVMIVDWKLPDTTGPAIVRAVRERHGEHVEAIVLSGFESDQLSQVDLALFAAHVAKPIDDLHQLSALVRDAVARKARGASSLR